MKQKVMISIAPVCAADSLVIPEAVAQQALAAGQAGASIVHLHCRNRHGQLTAQPNDFQQTIDLIMEHSDLIIQASTGGVSDLTIEQRCVPLEHRGVEMASLNVGSVNLGESVYINRPEDVRWCSEKVVERQIIPEFEVFELGMIHTISVLQQSIPFQQPLLYNIVLGHQGAAPANIPTLMAMRQFIPEDALWGFTHYGRSDFSLMAAAVAMGADEVRIGFEDSHLLSPGQVAADNAALVTALVDVIETLGRKVASADEARSQLNITG